MFSSRMLIALLIPAIILGFAAWLSAATELNRNEVKVAGELLSGVDVGLEVRECALSEEGGTRALSLAVEARNAGAGDVSLNPLLFQLVLVKGDDPLSRASLKGVYQPLRFTSTCPEAPESVSRIPPSSTRYIALTFWGGNLPRGEEWDEYLLSLEYYDPGNSIVLSKLITPPRE
ncbi:MAG: hypothetical protein H5T73_07410 [Actinobacteria bacterium]|nr:hypothetical protein [Actinomycetota bacterium]